MRIVRNLKRRVFQVMIAAPVALGFARLALAQQTILTPETQPVNLAITIGGKNVVYGLADYIGVLYNYLTAAAFIIAAVLITVGGFQWALAAGSPKMIASAKRRVTNALIGLIIIVMSYVLLLTINPAFVNPVVPPIKKIERVNIVTGTCSNTSDPKFACGAIIKDVPKVGQSCVGSVCQRGSQKCVSLKDAAGNDKYECLDTANCPTTCADIIGAFGANWQNVCASTLCSAKIPALCFVSGSTECVERRDENGSCSATEPCRRPYSCANGRCARVSLEGWYPCLEDTECQSGICNKANRYIDPSLRTDPKEGMAPHGGGTCVPPGGYSIENSQSMGYADEEYGYAECEYSTEDPGGRRGMCGSGGCVLPSEGYHPDVIGYQEGTTKYTSGVCSSLMMGNVCDANMRDPSGALAQSGKYVRRPCRAGTCLDPNGEDKPVGGSEEMDAFRCQ